MLLLPPGSAIVRSVHWTLQPSFCPITTPTYHAPACRWSKVSVVCLSPVHFQGFRARQVSCYALFEGWLLLSLPPCCLCSKTPFCLTLSRHLGTLTLVWVVPLSVMRLTPHKPASQLLRSLYSEFEWTASPFGPLPSDRCSTIQAISAEARLRSTSVGTRSPD